MILATAKVVGVIGAAMIGVAGVGALVFGVSSPPVAPADVEHAIKAKRAVPKDAKHLWAVQADGGTLLRDPLPTLDDGGCQAWATRCVDKMCKASCD